MKTQRIRHPLLGTIPLFGAGVFLKEGDFSIYRPTDQRQSVEAGWSFPGNLALKVPANYGGIFGIQKFLDVPAQNLTAPVPVPEPAGNHLPPVILRPQLSMYAASSVKRSESSASRLSSQRENHFRMVSSLCFIPPVLSENRQFLRREFRALSHWGAGRRWSALRQFPDRLPG